MNEVKTLHRLLIEELGKRSIEKTVLPNSIMGNLNPAFAMRPYQARAFQFFLITGKKNLMANHARIISCYFTWRQAAAKR